MMKRSATALLLLTSLFLSACGSNFANDLRLTLSLSVPLVDSLIEAHVIPASLRNGLLADFSELAQGAASLKDDLDACKGKVCKLGAVEKYEGLFERVVARGRFGRADKLKNIETILRGILSAAKMYYGGVPSGLSRQSSGKQKSMDQQLADLKREMQP